MRFETDRRRRYQRRCSCCDGTTQVQDTRRASSMVRGAGCREINLRIRRREKNVLDIPSPRTWLTTPVESTKRSRQVFGTSDPAECAVNCFYRSTAFIDQLLL